MCLNAGERAAKKSMNLKLTLNERKEEQQQTLLLFLFLSFSVNFKMLLISCFLQMATGAFGREGCVFH